MTVRRQCPGANLILITYCSVRFAEGFPFVLIGLLTLGLTPCTVANIGLLRPVFLKEYSLCAFLRLQKLHLISHSSIFRDPRVF